MEQFKGGSLSGFAWKHEGVSRQYVIYRDADEKEMKVGKRTVQDVLHTIQTE